MQDVKGGGKSGDACLPAYPQERDRLLSLRILGMERRQGAPAVSAGDRIGWPKKAAF